MPKVKDTTITNTKIAEYFSVSVQTLSSWKKSSDIGLNERYEALKRYLEEKVKKKILANSEVTYLNLI